MSKAQEASSILKVGFARSNRPYFDSTYVIRVPFLTGIAVCISCAFFKGKKTFTKKLTI